MNDTSLIIVSDYVLFRQGLRLMFEAHDGFIPLADMGCSSMTVQEVKKLQARIVIVDVDCRVEKTAGLRSMLQELTTFSKVIVVWAEYRKDVVAGIRISGYHSKFASGAELRYLVRETIASGSSRPPKLPATSRHFTNAGLFHLLSAREAEICGLVAQGSTSKEIAAHLSLSIKTIEVHRHNILKKLNFSNTSALVNFLTSGNRILNANPAE
jgi:DNA-binding NarL/FixJ family response regulator